METNLKDRVVLITGAGGGIGLTTVDAFLEEGALVVGADIKPEALESRANVVAVTADVLDPSCGETLAARTLAEHGRIDVLVNVAGGSDPHDDRFLQASMADWKAMFDFNLFSMVQLTRAVLPHMIDAGRGAIVSLGSLAGHQPETYMLDYSASKAAVLSVSKSISLAYGHHGIRSNVVSPGITRTPAVEGYLHHMADGMGGDMDAAIAQVVANPRIPLGRIGETPDIAAAIVFLASDAAAHVTGVDLHVDGGSTAAA